MDIIENAKKTLRSLSLKIRKLFDTKYENIIFAYRSVHILRHNNNLPKCDFEIYFYNKKIINYKYVINYDVTNKYYLVENNKIWDKTGDKMDEIYVDLNKFKQINAEFRKFIIDNTEIFKTLNNLMDLKFTIEKIINNILDINRVMKYKNYIIETVELALIIAFPWLNFETDVIVDNVDKYQIPITFINRRFKIATIISLYGVSTVYQRYYLQKRKYKVFCALSHFDNNFNMDTIWLKLKDYIIMWMYNHDKKVKNTYIMLFDYYTRIAYFNQYKTLSYLYNNFDKIKQAFENKQLTPKEEKIFQKLVMERDQIDAILKNTNIMKKILKEI